MSDKPTDCPPHDWQPSASMPDVRFCRRCGTVVFGPPRTRSIKSPARLIGLLVVCTTILMFLLLGKGCDNAG
jgi:hypothetical protein